MTSWIRWGPTALLLVAIAGPLRASTMTDDSDSGTVIDLHSELVSSHLTAVASPTPLDLTRTYTNTTGTEIDNLTIDFSVVSGEVTFASATDSPSKTFPSISVLPTSVTFAGAKILPDESVTVHVTGTEMLPNTISVSITGTAAPSGDTVPEPISLMIWGVGTAVTAVVGHGRRTRRDPAARRLGPNTAG